MWDWMHYWQPLKFRWAQLAKICFLFDTSKCALWLFNWNIIARNTRSGAPLPCLESQSVSSLGFGAATLQ